MHDVSSSSHSRTTAYSPTQVFCFIIDKQSGTIAIQQVGFRSSFLMAQQLESNSLCPTTSFELAARPHNSSRLALRGGLLGIASDG